MFELFAPLIIGLIGSAHCLGMCGPLVVAYALHNRTVTGSASSAGAFSWNRGLLQHGAFHLGRLCTYGVLGASAAGLFRAADISRWLFHIQGGMKVLGGVLLVLMGLALLKIVRVPAWAASLAPPPGSFLGRSLPLLLRSPHVLPKVALGMATGLLPCCLSWAMVVTAAATQDPLKGWITMTLFGLGTVPALLLAGLSAHFLGQRVRFLGEWVAAAAVISMGLILVLQGVGWIA
jgi:sulfite exporter TauE/SafE